MGNEQGEYGERLAAVETEVRALMSMLTRIESKLDASYANFVTKDILTEMLRSRDEKIARLEDDIRTKKKAWPQWASNVIAALALAYAWYHNR